MEYQLITEGITNILEYQEEKKCELPNENENNI